MTALAPRGTCLVVGATGFTGRALVRAARAGGMTVVAHVRPGASGDRKAAEIEADGARVSRAAWTLEAMTELVTSTRPDAVFLLLGTTRARTSAAKKEGRDESYEAIDYGLTALAIDAILAAGLRPVVVYLSSAGAGGTGSAYMAARTRCEAKLRASGLPFRIARPSFITGEGREDARPGERIGSKLADGALAFVGALGAGRLRDRYASTSPEVLAGGLLRIASSEADGVFESETLR